MSTQDKTNKLMAAIRNGDYNLVKHLLEVELIDPNIYDSLANAPIRLANNQEIFNLLIENGSDLKPMSRLPYFDMKYHLTRFASVAIGLILIPLELCLNILTIGIYGLLMSYLLMTHDFIGIGGWLAPIRTLVNRYFFSGYEFENEIKNIRIKEYYLDWTTSEYTYVFPQEKYFKNNLQILFNPISLFSDQTVVEYIAKYETLDDTGSNGLSYIADVLKDLSFQEIRYLLQNDKFQLLANQENDLANVLCKAVSDSLNRVEVYRFDRQFNVLKKYGVDLQKFILLAENDTFLKCARQDSKLGIIIRDSIKQTIEEATFSELGLLLENDDLLQALEEDSSSLRNIISDSIEGRFGRLSSQEQDGLAQHLIVQNSELGNMILQDSGVVVGIEISSNRNTLFNSTRFDEIPTGEPMPVVIL